MVSSLHGKPLACRERGSRPVGDKEMSRAWNCQLARTTHVLLLSRLLNQLESVAASPPVLPIE